MYAILFLSEFTNAAAFAVYPVLKKHTLPAIIVLPKDNGKVFMSIYKLTYLQEQCL